MEEMARQIFQKSQDAVLNVNKTLKKNLKKTF